MSTAFTAAIHSMHNDLQRMDIISQNLVNLTTPGYKRGIARSFGEVMLAADSQTSSDHHIAHTLPSISSVVDLSEGAVRQTGQPWDMAIVGEGYFELATPAGLAYSRAGNFHLDAEGRLVNEAGFAVQGMAGELRLNDGKAQISADGRISQGENPVGQIRLVRFAEPHALQKNPLGLLSPAAGNNAIEVTPQLQVGALESTNVVPARDMVAMLETTRHFEAAQKLFQGYDEMLGTAIQKLGEF
ncbi:flagellar hook-basal body protein [Chitinimonas sp.]|uniref:flagellar hook-basal body protein n=1 Tax=Chitinimonas sp. TaxID=1934313 RepID=UPI0035B12DE2